MGSIRSTAVSLGSKLSTPAERNRDDTSPDSAAEPAPLPGDRLSKPFGSTTRDSDGMFYLHIADQGVKSRPQPITETRRTLFLGESFSLTYVVHDVLAPFLSEAPNYQRRLHFPISEGFDPSDKDQQNVVEAQLQQLRERKILYRLDNKAKEQLLLVYFRWFHPAFPVLHRAKFLQESLANEVSLLLLNSVLMIAVTMCTDRELALTGISNRYEAREIFYRQARACMMQIQTQTKSTT